MSSLSTMSEPRAELARAQVAINAALARFADRHLDGTPDRVRDAIRYSLLGEGKRMRGILVMSAYEAAGGLGDASELAAAVEVVHAYSLVHDDLPCMDDDDMRPADGAQGVRRGRGHRGRTRHGASRRAVRRRSGTGARAG